MRPLPGAPQAHAKRRECRYPVPGCTPRAPMRGEGADVGVIAADRSAGRIRRRPMAKDDVEGRNAGGLLPRHVPGALGAAAGSDRRRGGPWAARGRPRAASAPGAAKAGPQCARPGRDACTSPPAHDRGVWAGPPSGCARLCWRAAASRPGSKERPACRAPSVPAGASSGSRPSSTCRTQSATRRSARGLPRPTSRREKRSSATRGREPRGAGAR